MPPSFPLLFAILILAPGLLIPLLVISRMRRIVGEVEAAPSERHVARAAMVAMGGLMLFSLYAAWEVYSRLSALAA